MGPFDDDFFGGGFDELFKRLAGDGLVEYSINDNGRKKTIKRGKRDVFGKLFLDRVNTPKKIFLIFDLSGKKDVSVKMGKDNESGNKILEIYEDREHLFDFPLEEINTKDFETKFNNGILEVSFKK